MTQECFVFPSTKIFISEWQIRDINDSMGEGGGEEYTYFDFACVMRAGY